MVIGTELGLILETGKTNPNGWIFSRLSPEGLFLFPASKENQDYAAALGFRKTLDCFHQHMRALAWIELTGEQTRDLIVGNTEFRSSLRPQFQPRHLVTPKGGCIHAIA